AAAFIYTRSAVQDVVADSEAEAATMLQRLATETPIDMRSFASLPAEGPADARVQIVVASDFQCSFCRNLAARLDELRAQYPHDVRILFLNAPIGTHCNPYVRNDVHEHACWLARAGVCAVQQDRFWQFHHLVYRELSPLHVDERGVRR